MKFHSTLAAAAALIAASSLSSNAEAGATRAATNIAETKVAVLDAPASTDAIRTIDLKPEPIEQPADQAAAPPADPAVDAPAARNDTTANSATPAETKRICRKFSAVIAEIIEVPCE